MIEIRITIDAALNLLLERMKFELKFRQDQNIISSNLKMEYLSSHDLLDLIETSIFDTVFLLPVDLLNSDTNLAQIISATVRALAKVLNREELYLYSNPKAKKLIDPICLYLEKSLRNQNFKNN
jgi:hypothetical protein